MTRATGIGPLPELLEAFEGEKTLRAVFADADLPLALAKERTYRIPLAALARLYHAAAERTRNPAFGLIAGQAMAFGDFGKWVLYAGQAPTLADGISRAIETLHLHQTGTLMRLVPRADGKIAWEYDHRDISTALFRQHSDHIIPSMIRFVQTFLGQDWRPVRVEMAYPAPEQADDLERMTEAAWTFDCTCLAIVLSPEDFRPRAKPGADAPPQVPLTYCDVLAEARLEWPDTTVENVAAIISLRLLEGNSDIEGAARILGKGCRTLQRQLADQGLDYRSLVTRLRMQRAKNLIEETATPLKEVCSLSGYSDPAHFTRAFKKHFGYPPSYLRQKGTGA